MADRTPEKLTGVNGDYVKDYRSFLDPDNIATYTDRNTGRKIQWVNGQFKDPITGADLRIDSYGNFVRR